MFALMLLISEKIGSILFQIGVEFHQLLAFIEILGEERLIDIDVTKDCKYASHL